VRAELAYYARAVKWHGAAGGGPLPITSSRMGRLLDWPAGPNSKRRDKWIYYQYKADRARRTLRGIDEQVAKAVADLAPVKRNRSSRSTAQ